MHNTTPHRPFLLSSVFFSPHPITPLLPPARTPQTKWTQQILFYFYFKWMDKYYLHYSRDYYNVVHNIHSGGGWGCRWCGGTGRPLKRKWHFCPCIIFSAFNFLYVVALLIRPILLLRSSSCFQLVLKLPPTFNPNIHTVWTWNPCSPYTIVTLVAPALFIFMNILATGATDIG